MRSVQRSDVRPLRASEDAEQLGAGLGAGELVCGGGQECHLKPAAGAAGGPTSLDATFSGKFAEGEWKICVGDSNLGGAGVLYAHGIFLMLSNPGGSVHTVGPAGTYPNGVVIPDGAYDGTLASMACDSVEFSCTSAGASARPVWATAGRDASELCQSARVPVVAARRQHCLRDAPRIGGASACHQRSNAEQLSLGTQRVRRRIALVPVEGSERGGRITALESAPGRVQGGDLALELALGDACEACHRSGLGRLAFSFRIVAGTASRQLRAETREQGREHEVPPRNS